jgi:hypothetical protein
MELKNITLNEVSQAQKTKNHMFSLTCGLCKCSNAVGLGSYDRGTAYFGDIEIGRKPKT